MTTQEILNDLNESQRRAVEYNEGPQLVVAGAGAGKTRVLTYKIAYLLACGVKPWNILALTFTNKAAREMESRIKRLVGDDKASGLNMGTFHSLMAKMLRREAASVGFDSNYTIYDESDSRSLIKTIVKELALDEKVYKPSFVHGRISMAKNHCISSFEYAANGEIASRDEYDGVGSVGKIFTLYDQRLRQANAMDFDDLLLVSYRLLNTNEDVREKYAARFTHILVDEYQDTNTVQQRIVSLLAGRRGYVCAVGDDYQSIYAFRGAKIDNILNFRKLFDDCELFKLERNYRSTKLIVGAANSLMKHNERQIAKDVYSENDEGSPIHLAEAYSDKEEACIVAKEIKKAARSRNLPYKDIAILYRTNAQSRTFEEEFRKQNIPYQIFGGLSFYQRKEIKDVIAYFRMVGNPNDEEAFRRIINYPTRGIGSTTLVKISEQAHSHEVSYWEVITNPTLYELSLNKGTLNKIEQFRLLIEDFRSEREQLDASELGKKIIAKSGISADIFAGTEPEDISRQENIEQLINSLSEFVEDRREQGMEDECKLEDYLQEVSLMTDLDGMSSDNNKVSLMTVHSAKGLEFDTVFVVGLEEELFPSAKSLSTQSQLEEERRLLYVAITRAEKQCYLLWSQMRWKFGSMDYQRPSRFLKEISNEFLSKLTAASEISGSRDNKRSAFSSTRKVGGSFDNIFTAPRSSTYVAPKPTRQRLTRIVRSSAPADSPEQYDGNLKVGMRLEHQRFGKGTIVNLEGAGENAKATVEFDNAGKKQLLLKFAKFNIIH